MVNYKRRIVTVLLSVLCFGLIIIVWKHDRTGCDYRVSTTGNIYDKDDKYWSLTGYKRNLCYLEALKEKELIKSLKKTK